MKLKVQDYLRNFADPDDALESLAIEYEIQVKHEDDLVILNYNISSPASDITDECRALVLDYPAFNIVSFSFMRFFNYGEGRAAPIDWKTAKAMEKLDGSLIVFYWRNGQWDLHTRSVIGAECEVPAGRYTFRDRVLKLFADRGLTMESAFAEIPHNVCIVCEYVGPYNRIVTPYAAEQLYLLAITDKCTASDTSIDKPYWWPFAYPVGFAFNGSLDSLLRLIPTLPKLHEGFVVRDANGNRIKVKNPSYLAVHRTINAGAICTDKHFAQMAIAGDTAEIKSYFPEMTARIDAVELTLANAICEAESLWSIFGSVGDRKAFALSVKHAKLSPWLFQKHSGRATSDIRGWVFGNLRPEKLAEWMPSN